MVYFCCVNGCKTKWYSGCGLSFHRIPKDALMAERWKQNIPDKVIKTSVVCSLHLKNEYFVNQSRKRLKSTAIPSIFLKIVPAEKDMHMLSSILLIVFDVVKYTEKLFVTLSTLIEEHLKKKYMINIITQHFYPRLKDISHPVQSHSTDT